MQHTQFNFIRVLIAGAVVVLTASGAAAGTMARPAKPDPLLDGGPTAPCAAGPDYAAASDVNGRPVIPADIGTPPVPMPDAIAVPVPQGSRHRHARSAESAYVSIDGRKLAPLLNPPPCR